MSKKLSVALTSAVLLLLPIAALADLPRPGLPGQIGDILTVVNHILNFIWPIFVGFSVIMFIVAGFYFLAAQGDPGKISTARMMLLWGVIGVIVGIAAFSLPWIIANGLNP